MLDRNKTEATHRVTDAATLWLLDAGFKPVEAEVPVAARWCADIAGVAQLTRTEATTLKLTTNKPRARDFPAGYADAEYQRRCGLWEESYAALPETVTALVEVKTTRADFRADRKWERERAAHLSFLAVPQHLLAPGEYPQGWGILEHREGRSLRLVRVPELAEVATAQTLRFVLALAERQYNREHYAAHKQTLQEQRIAANRDISRTRVRAAMTAVLAIAAGRGESVADVLARNRISADSLGFALAELEALWNIFGVQNPDEICMTCRNRKLRL